VTVYVDSGRNQFRHMIMSHMVADTVEELHAMAQRLGLKRSWFQKSRNGMPHYDICQTKREQAIALGAEVIDRRKMVELMRKNREAKGIQNVQTWNDGQRQRNGAEGHAHTPSS
jgi:hypothetical protein